MTDEREGGAMPRKVRILLWLFGVVLIGNMLVVCYSLAVGNAPAAIGPMLGFFGAAIALPAVVAGWGRKP